MSTFSRGDDFEWRPGMAHEFDPGYNRYPFKTLVRNYPGTDVYPPTDFRTEWGPIFHRGRLDGTARVLVLGQDPGAHEAIVRRILVGEAGQRLQGFLAKLGIDSSYVMINTFLYSVYGQGGGDRHRNDPAIAAYRHRWLDALLAGSSVEVVVALGVLAELAFSDWQATTSGKATAVAFRRITHPTYPEGQRTLPRAEATKQMLKNWNQALAALRPKVRHPDFPQPTDTYGTALNKARDLAPIPDRDLPPGLPDWMRSLRSWAQREAVRAGDPAQEKRATVVARIPVSERDWLQG
jgi:uracil-DNA glycosylase